MDTIKLIFDSKSVRSIDENGFLHVAISPLTKEQVAPYYGREIPGWEELGLDPGKVYRGYRSAAELSKPETVKSTDGIPVQFRHHPDFADAPAKATRVGLTGTDGKWEPPYLMNSLHILDKNAQEAIRDGSMRELSLAYRYTPDFTPGETEDGEKYDFVMRDINANHVALVEEGRAGGDVLVMDSSLENHKEINDMEEEKKEPATGEAVAKAAPGEGEKGGLGAVNAVVAAAVKAGLCKPGSESEWKARIASFADEQNAVSKIKDGDDSAEDEEPDDGTAPADYSDSGEETETGEYTDQDADQVEEDEEPEGVEGRRHINRGDIDAFCEELRKLCDRFEGRGGEAEDEDSLDIEEKDDRKDGDGEESDSYDIDLTGGEDEAAEGDPEEEENRRRDVVGDRCSRRLGQDSIEMIAKAAEAKVSAKYRAMDEVAPTLGRVRYQAFDSADAIYQAAYRQETGKTISRKLARTAYRALMTGKKMTAKAAMSMDAKPKPSALDKFFGNVM